MATQAEAVVQHCHLHTRVVRVLGVGFTRAMAAELGPHGIRVNTICPTFVETPMTKPFFEDKAFSDWVMERIKLGRLGKIEDIMGAVTYLASDASALMTGSSLMLDAGWTGT